MSVVTYFELCFGASKSDRTEMVMKKLEEFRELVPVLPLTSDAGEAYGFIRNDLKRRGVLIGAHDMLIAAHALSLGATLVTNNISEFHRVRGLKLENWA